MLHPGSRNAYTNAKADFVAQVLRRAGMRRRPAIRCLNSRSYEGGVSSSTRRLTRLRISSRMGAPRRARGRGIGRSQSR